MCIIHKYKIIKFQTTINTTYGMDDVPGLRVIKKCIKCNKIKTTSLNLVMDNKYLESKYDYMWKNI